MRRAKIRLNSTVFVGLLFVILSLFIWVLIPNEIKILEESSRVDAQTFPKIVSIIMFLLSILLIIQGLFTTNKEKNAKHGNGRKEVKTILIMLIFLIYASTIEILGFLISSIILCIVLLMVNRIRNWKYYLSIVIIVLSIFVIFEHLLSLNLP